MGEYYPNTLHTRYKYLFFYFFYIKININKSIWFFFLNKTFFGPFFSSTKVSFLKKKLHHARRMSPSFPYFTNTFCKPKGTCEGCSFVYICLKKKKEKETYNNLFLKKKSAYWTAMQRNVTGKKTMKVFFSTCLQSDLVKIPNKSPLIKNILKSLINKEVTFSTLSFYVFNRKKKKKQNNNNKWNQRKTVIKEEGQFYIT